VAAWREKASLPVQRRCSDVGYLSADGGPRNVREDKGKKEGRREGGRKEGLWVQSGRRKAPVS
jgi:hypothetical protein